MHGVWNTWSFVSGWITWIAYSEVTNWGFSTKWAIKRLLGEQHIIRGTHLSPIRVFWAIIHENWLTGLGCTLDKEYKNIKSTSTGHYLFCAALLHNNELYLAYKTQGYLLLFHLNAETRNVIGQKGVTWPKNRID